MRYLSSIGIALVAVFVSACGTPESASDEITLTEWLDQQYARQLEFSPVQLSRSGNHSRHGEIDEVSDAAFVEQLEWKGSSVEQMQRIFDYDQLSDDEKLSYDLWAYQYEQMQRGAEFRQLEYVFEQMIGPQSTLPQVLIGSHEVRSMQDMGDYNKRIRAIAGRINELVEIAQQRAEQGLRPPRFAYNEVIRQAEGVITGVPFEEGSDSPIWQDAQTKVANLLETNSVNERGADLLLEDTQAALTEALYPAYQNLISWLQDDLPNTLENPEGISRHQGGDAYYEYLLWFYTTTELNADQIHQIGLDEVARLTAELEDVRERVGFEGDLDAFFQFFREDEQFFYPNTDEGREAYLQQARDYLATMNEQMSKFFGLLPEIELEVRRVEAYREQAGAPQHYMRGSPHNGRPGIFYAHLIDMQAMARNELEAIAYHEGFPGHHQQISVAQQASDIANFRTQARFTVYTEGWALYAEWLAKEMGAYQDPYSEFGQLVTELWRAVRLVVDTGLHSKGWTRQQAIDYFATTTPVSAGAIQTEIERYMTLPGQATSFKIGMIKIQQLRREAEAALGDNFDIRGFHDAVLGGGAMPLPMLERKVQQWIDSELAE
ncbi:DUF885 domain-containing protein [Aliidiomarina soli]|uniref:DUF885 domain-containing protein n=1 Tax=Aliidiomarina soli TaxID=1928574 RepID=A0A432WHG1_9GAMM|nr:DUF885 domain-containing protein [Aliidiomarina soli]RUO33195.1 DUF885 domain-containing protein [Aliidiomarina soli]